ncbi:penicillin acylase family protein [Bacteroidota bacterium]
MKKSGFYFTQIFILAIFFGQNLISQETYTLKVPGLEQEVEIIKDNWGISHIYAQTEHDLFFAQGYNAARDRLFQFEIWRTRATGTLAEIIGPRAIDHDHGIRLFKFRGNIKQEMDHYHPRGQKIITAFVEGVNAYIDQVLKEPENLPLPFQLLDIKPRHWTPEVLISRHQGLLRNVEIELATTRAVCLIGEDKVKNIEFFDPREPDLSLNEIIDCESLLENDILKYYNAFKQNLYFQPEDIVLSDYRNNNESFIELQALLESERQSLVYEQSIGSNNWIVSGELTLNRFPLMANDPHRTISVPSLRYWVHLVGPGWNVIGGGESEIPGVSIGHNDYGAWGLTLFSTDMEDLYVYQTNPKNPNQYFYNGNWEDMRIINETIQVKGQKPVKVMLKYTRHGPITFEDSKNNLAYAIRCAWQEIGCTPYLASLRMNQANNWEEFRDACSYSHLPGENMVWADKNGNIGWQAVAIAPIRRNFSGMVLVPGDGRYEWDGYLPIQDLPHVFNPKQGYYETSNSYTVSRNYEYMDAIGYTWYDPFRWARANEILASGRKLSMMDMMKLQNDYLSIPARNIIPLLENLKSDDKQVEEARILLLEWDYVLDKKSVEAGIYVAFENQLLKKIQDIKVPSEAQKYVSVGMSHLLEFILSPDEDFGSDPIAGRNVFLINELEEAVQNLREKLGPEIEDWIYGQEKYKHCLIRHPLSFAVDEEIRKKLDIGPLPRGGNSYTVSLTRNVDNQNHGATFRIIVDTKNWDNSLGINSPGQVGDPQSPFYDNLFDLWANDNYFPVFYSRDKIEGVAFEKLELQP